MPLSTTCSYNLTLKRLVCMVQESANMLCLQNNVVYSFSLGKLLFALIFGFYEKTEALLLPNGNSETLDISKSGVGNAVIITIYSILQIDKTEEG